MPTKLHCTNVLVPLTVLFNSNLSSGEVSTLLKEAFIMPILEKAEIDQADMKIFWSNLSAVSKILKRLIGKQLPD
jgi:hypothetical protein